MLIIQQARAHLLDTEPFEHAAAVSVMRPPLECGRITFSSSLKQDMDDYLNVCRFLPKLNNEILGERNAPYKERLGSLENLVLIMG